MLLIVASADESNHHVPPFIHHPCPVTLLFIIIFPFVLLPSPQVAFDWDKDELVYTPSYTEALDPRNAGSKLAMHGIPSYNMLMNPEIQAAFAITPEFARTHKTLGEVALYRIGQSSRRFKGTGGSKGRMARNSSGHDRDSSQPQSWSPPISPGSAGSYNGGLSPMSAGGGSVGSGHGSVNGGIGGGGGDPNGIMTSPTGANSVVGFAGVTAGPIVDGVAVPVIPLQGSGFMMPQVSEHGHILFTSFLRCRWKLTRCQRLFVSSARRSNLLRHSS